MSGFLSDGATDFQVVCGSTVISSKTYIGYIRGTIGTLSPAPTTLRGDFRIEEAYFFVDDGPSPTFHVAVAGGAASPPFASLASAKLTRVSTGLSYDLVPNSGNSAAPAGGRYWRFFNVPTLVNGETLLLSLQFR